MIYLDTNIFYTAYSPVEESEKADQIISELNDTLIGITSEWTIIEIFRAFKKQVNLQVLEEEDEKIAV